MEKCLGTFPKAILDKTPDFNKYFRESNGGDNGGKIVHVNTDKLDKDSLRHLSEMKPLNEFTTDTDKVKDIGQKDDKFLVLLKGLLCIDPAQRMTAQEAVEAYGEFQPDSDVLSVGERSE